MTDTTAGLEIPYSTTDDTIESIAATMQSLAERLDFLLGSGAAWGAYSPAWTANTTNPAKGNGTLTGKYLQIGRLVHFRILLLGGSTTTWGSGAYRWSLPVEAADSSEIIDATVHLYDSSASLHKVAVATYVDANTIQAWIDTGVGPNTPWTWANGDRIQLAGSYEAAAVA